jgi:hypothetical protein
MKQLPLLIIEDDRRRIQQFNDWMPDRFRTVFVKSAGIALGLLERDRGYIYAGICLDHDLQQQVAADSDRDLSGTTVINAIIKYISSDVPVLVHSRNLNRARYMENKLTDSGFYVTRIAMDDLTKKLFHEWLAEAGELYDDEHA